MNDMTRKSKDWSCTHIDLVSERYGGQVLDCNDEFFAEANNLVKVSKPVYKTDVYTERGKWMDGWETRRRRDEGYDWCILRLGIVGRIYAVDIDSAHFKGNSPSQISLQACYQRADPNESSSWTTIVEQRDIEPDSCNRIEIDDARSWSHLKLNIFPDGGIARLRVYGEALVDWSNILPNELVDLAASVNGGRAIACSDMFFSAMNNIIAPGRAQNMGDAWETRRRRGPGNDWLIVKLADLGKIARVIVDTKYFKGNFPESFSLEGVSSSDDAAVMDFDSTTKLNWIPLIPRTKLSANTEHVYEKELLDKVNAFSHIRLNIYPDGGVSRLRVYGYPVAGDV